VIATFPTTATAIGVRPTPNSLELFAPFGLDDLFNRIVRANKVQISQAIYEAKTKKWTDRWPGLCIVGWDE